MGLLQLGLGLAGAHQMYKGNKGMTNLANNMPDKAALQDPFQNTQGLINRMTNFGQYSGQSMDLASMQGNKGVEDAMMMGMGGSQANAIKNRMKRSSLAGVYDQYNQGLGQAAGLQQGIDSQVSSQMQSNRDQARNIRMGQYGAQMGIGNQMLGEKGIRGLMGMAGSVVG